MVALCIAVSRRTLVHISFPPRRSERQNSKTIHGKVQQDNVPASRVEKRAAAFVSRRSMLRSRSAHKARRDQQASKSSKKVAERKNTTATTQGEYYLGPRLRHNPPTHLSPSQPNGPALYAAPRRAHQPDHLTLTSKHHQRFRWQTDICKDQHSANERGSGRIWALTFCLQRQGARPTTAALRWQERHGAKRFARRPRLCACYS